MAKRSSERRQHRRHELACPVHLRPAGDGEPARARGVNISDGGMLVPLPADAAPTPGTRVELDFSVPRSTPNTFLFERLSAKAFVVRNQPSGTDHECHVAVRFERPLDLGLEV